MGAAVRYRWLDQIQPVEDKKDRDEGVKDQADDHNHIENLRVFAFRGFHVIQPPACCR